MRLNEATILIGGYSKGNAKLNCPSWGTSTDTCTKHFPGNKHSTCNSKNCYAQRNQYVFPNVKQAHQRREAASKRPQFTEALTRVVSNTEFFRFFDSGDFGNHHTFNSIMTACRDAKQTRIWIPSKKYLITTHAQKKQLVSDNTILRTGMWLIDPTPAQVKYFSYEFHYFTLVAHQARLKETTYLLDGKPIHVCPATKPSEETHLKERCLIDCRACWDPNERGIIFPWH